jgi:UDP-galactopyranose mutase
MAFTSGDRSNVSLDILVVGAGFAGSVVARQLAEAGRQVLIIDNRSHIGGNAFDEVDAHGLLVHRYGPHLFHTNSQPVYEFLSRFTEWHSYQHRVLAQVDGKLLPLPINQDTINRLYGLDLSEAEVAEFFGRVREKRAPVLTSEDVVLNSVGRELCEKFFRGYTRKQWGLDLSELDAGVAARIPTRTNREDRYFTDAYQGLPREGYTRMFERILDHPNIRIELDTAFSAELRMTANLIIYTGPIDEFFGYRFGKLPYRSLRFEHEHLAGTERFQPVGTVNYPNDHNFTRITEFKHLTGQKNSGTSIVREFPCGEGDPYYPVLRPESRKLLKRYEELAAQERNCIFVGRLAQFRYYNMDQAVAAALHVVTQVIGS